MLHPLLDYYEEGQPVTCQPAPTQPLAALHGIKQMMGNGE